jgi:isoquinoline 1-oxidoreductase beta subunit
MEPMNCTARYTADRCEVWAPTQDGQATFAAVLSASGLPADKCEVYKINLGGGYGRRSGLHQDWVRQAVLIAKQVPGVPIKLLWSREEDMRQGRYHPVMQCKLTGGFDANNNLTALHMRLSGQSIFAAVLPQMLEKDKGRDAFVFQGVTAANLLNGEYALGYSFPNLLIDHAMRNTHVPPGVWRGVNINQNCIFMECFIDELAQAVGQDELEFRRKLMANHPKNLAVLNAVAERIGWGKPPPQGVHRGLAHMKAFNAYVAAAAEVSVEGGNRIKIHRIVAATDPIYAVNPAQIERQVSGSFVYGLSALFYGACTVEKGRIVEGNFDTYDSIRMAQMPPVETIIMGSGGSDPWGGIGEPTICVAAPAVLNAYAKATGQRVRSIPLKDQRIRMA